MWRWVTPAPIEAAYVLWVFKEEGREPRTFPWHLIHALEAAPEPTLLQMASVFPGYASAVVCAKDGDFDKLREVAGDYVTS